MKKTHTSSLWFTLYRMPYLLGITLCRSPLCFLLPPTEGPSSPHGSHHYPWRSRCARAWPTQYPYLAVALPPDSWWSSSSTDTHGYTMHLLPPKSHRLANRNVKHPISHPRRFLTWPYWAFRSMDPFTLVFFGCFCFVFVCTFALPFPIPAWIPGLIIIIIMLQICWVHSASSFTASTYRPPVLEELHHPPPLCWCLSNWVLT